MKEKRIRILIVSTLVIVAVSAAISVTLPRISKPKQTPPPKSAVSTIRQEYKYIVRAYNGKLAVFEAGESKPFRVTDLDVAMLPQSDQSILAVGIQVQDNKELSRILEDFCS